MRQIKTRLGHILRILSFSLLAALPGLGVTQGTTAGNAPRLPLAGTRIVNVATEFELQAAMTNLRNGDTLLLTNGVYHLTSSLFVNAHHNVTIRGLDGCTNVVLAGKGMDNPNFGNTRFGVWSNSTNTTIAHLTIRDTYDNLVIFNPGARSPRLYCVKLLDAGSQFIKCNPTDVNAGVGVDDGRVEYCWLEYTVGPPGDHGAGAGYFNGISAHAAHNWILRGNLFKNLHNPDSAAYLWNPAVLFWRHSANTTTEQNTFIDVDRAVAYGLESATTYPDHSGGVIRNNFVWLAPGLMKPSRLAGSDGSIIAWNSPRTQIDHNTILLNDNESFAIEFRFSTTTDAAARNNLADKPIHLRDNATAALSGNLLGAAAGMFLNPSIGDLHLLPSATAAIDKATPLGSVTNDFDGDGRPQGSGYDIGADEFTPNLPLVITNIVLTGTNLVLSFPTAVGFEYDIQRADDLASKSWTTITTNVNGTGGLLQVKDLTSPQRQPERFYRVRLLP